MRKFVVFILLVLSAVTAGAFDTMLRSKGEDLFTDSIVAPGEVYEFPCRFNHISEQSFEIGLDPNKDKFEWTMEFEPADSNVLPLIIRVKAHQFNKFDNENFDKVYLTATCGDKLVGEGVLENTKMVYRSTNYLRLSVYGDGSTLAFGYSGLEDVMKLPPMGFFKAAKFSSNHKARILRTVTSYILAPSIFSSGMTDEKSIRKATRGSNIFPCGIWRRFDDAYNTASTAGGGNYTLAIMPMDEVRASLYSDPDFINRPSDERYPIDSANFAIIYLAGATSYPHLWHAGDIKGLLTLSPFTNTYELIWIDSTGQPITFGANATFDSNLLSFNFPLLQSLIRFCAVQ